MAITDDELAAIRDHVGAVPSDADIAAYWERLGTVEDVALVIIRRRLADLRARAAKFSAEGDYSEDFSENIKALERQEKTLSAAAAAAAAGVAVGDVQVGRIVRAGRRR